MGIERSLIPVLQHYLVEQEIDWLIKLHVCTFHVYHNPTPKLQPQGFS